MSFARLRSGEWVAGLGAVVLLVALLVLHWYGVTLRGGWWSYPPHHRVTPPVVFHFASTGWHAIPTLRWFVLATVVAGLTLALAQAAVPGPALPVTLDLIGMLIAGLTTILLIIRLASTGAPLRFGAVVGLAAAGVVTFGAYRAMRTEAGWTPGPGRPIEVVHVSTPD